MARKKPRKPDRSLEHLSPNESELLALLGMVKAVVPGRSELARSAEALVNRGLVERFKRDEFPSHFQYRLSTHRAREVSATFRFSDEAVARLFGPPAGGWDEGFDRSPPGIVMMETVIAISVGDLVKDKYRDIGGCVSKVAADDTIYVCMLFDGGVYPFPYDRGDLVRVGRNGPCDCLPA